MGAGTPEPAAVQMDPAEMESVINAIIGVEDAREICGEEGIAAPEGATAEELRGLLLRHYHCGPPLAEDEAAEAAEAEEAEEAAVEIVVGDDDDTPSAEASARRRKLLLMEAPEAEFMLDPNVQVRPRFQLVHGHTSSCGSLGSFVRLFLAESLELRGGIDDAPDGGSRFHSSVTRERFV